MFRNFRIFGVGACVERAREIYIDFYSRNKWPNMARSIKTVHNRIKFRSYIQTQSTVAPTFFSRYRKRGVAQMSTPNKRRPTQFSLPMPLAPLFTTAHVAKGQCFHTHAYLQSSLPLLPIHTPFSPPLEQVVEWWWGLALRLLLSPRGALWRHDCCIICVHVRIEELECSAAVVIEFCVIVCLN